MSALARLTETLGRKCAHGAVLKMSLHLTSSGWPDESAVVSSVKGHDADGSPPQHPLECRLYAEKQARDRADLRMRAGGRSHSSSSDESLKETHDSDTEAIAAERSRKHRRGCLGGATGTWRGFLSIF